MESPAAIDDPYERLLAQYTEIARLAGALAHEIKNPLSTIRLNMELLAEDIEEPQSPAQRRAVKRIGVMQLPLALVTLGGSVVAQSRAGRRSIPAREFFVSYFTTALEPDELVVETVWPSAGPGWGHAFEELALRHGDYALSMAACALRVEGGAVAEARLAVGAVAARPTLVEAPLAGRPVDVEAAREAGEAARAAVDPSGHLHASRDYLRHVTGILAERAVLGAWREAA
jgi:carbon-monoxide dehydrogenase medium subunit